MQSSLSVVIGHLMVVAGCAVEHQRGKTFSTSAEPIGAVARGGLRLFRAAARTPFPHRPPDSILNFIRKLVEHDDVLTSARCFAGHCVRANMATAALVRVLAVKCALATDNWRTFLSDLQELATLDLESLPLPADSMERHAAIRVAALDCLAASLNDLAQRLSDR